MKALSKIWIQACAALLFGLAFAVVPAQAQFTEVARLLASDKQNGDFFGESSAISDDRAIVGAYGEDTGGTDAGAAYIFERNAGGVWSQVAKIQASDKEAGDLFGFSVAISGDHAIVGAGGEDTGSFGAGAAYIFERNASGVWSQVAKIQASDKQAGDNFGVSVAINGDRAIVGADLEDTGGSDAGAAYIFERNASGVWSQVAKIQASDKQAGDYFGVSVAISGDRAVAGAWWEDTGGSDAGAAYIFERSGGVWSEVAKIQASDKQADDNFGYSVGISGDRAIVGAYQEDTGASNVGAAYIFERSSGVWSQVAKIQASDKEAFDRFGISVAISGDRALVGAYQDDVGNSLNVGAAYIFERSSGVWSQVAKIQASDRVSGDQFGYSVGVSGDRIIVGANSKDILGTGPSTGAAYIFELVLNQPPIANAGTDQSACTSTGSANITLNGSGSSDPDNDALTYTWKEGATTLATSVNPTVSLSVGAHTIVLTVADGKGGTNTDQVVITVRAAPVVTVTGASTCAGGSAPITASVSSGTGPFSYVWTVPNGAIDPGDVASFNATIAGSYSVVVTDANTCTGAGSGTLTVNPDPSVSVNSPTVCASELLATITASVSSGTGPFSYVWTVPSGAIDPGDVANFNATVAGVYSVVVSDANTCTGSGSGTLTVNPDPSVSVNSPTVCASELPATITASVSSSTAPFSYVWTVPGGASNPGDVASFNATVAGVYSVVVSDVHGCTGTGSGTLTINQPPTVDAGTEQSIYLTQSVQIGGSPTASGGLAPYTYAWSPATGLDDASIANPTASPASTTTYTVTVTGANGCNATDEVTVIVIPVKPFVFLANKITLESTKQAPSYGDLHSNGLLTVEKGDPSTYNSNLFAVGNITIGKYNTINGDVTSQTSISNSGTINGTKTIGPVNNEPLPSLSYSAGGPNKIVPSGGSLVLAPGSYGNVTMSNNGKLKLTSGEYFMNQLRYSSTIEGGVIEIDLSSGAPVTINVVSNLQLGHEAAIVLLPNGEADSKLVTFNTMQTVNANWGREAYFLGSFNAPNALVTLVKNTQLRGSICAKEIFVSNDCLFLHHDSPGSLPGLGNLPKASEEVVSGPLSVVSDYALEQNYPNPFNPTTMITFALPEAGEVSLSIYNMNGQLVRQLASGNYASGRYEIVWDGKNNNGARVVSGVYVYVLKAGTFTARKKLVLMK